MEESKLINTSKNSDKRNFDAAEITDKNSES
jgi:hypothetical protein